MSSICFFFSSRRRHTRSKRDWSSDVCSSDLIEQYHIYLNMVLFNGEKEIHIKPFIMVAGRSEERRVGKEWRYRVMKANSKNRVVSYTCYKIELIKKRQKTR